LPGWTSQRSTGGGRYQPFAGPFTVCHLTMVAATNFNGTLRRPGGGLCQGAAGRADDSDSYKLLKHNARDSAEPLTQNTEGIERLHLGEPARRHNSHLCLGRPRLGADRPREETEGSPGARGTTPGWRYLGVALLKPSSVLAVPQGHFADSFL